MSVRLGALGLEQYHKKRRFGRTPEPPPKPAATQGRSFVVQKHDATRLHYDFRMEIGGVLVSWAVPKGPSLNSKDKRLAVRTEDHPLEYADFEGVIPEGNYGAGPVEVWDNGTYQMEGALDAAEQLARGELKFSLSGKKLRGSFALIHTGKRSEDPKQQQNWLLIKHADEYADPNWDIERLDSSVLSGRTIREIEAGIAPAGNPGDLPGASPCPMPEWVEPNLATLIEEPFTNPDWVFELKWDGMRVLAWVRDGRVELRSRRSRDVTAQLPELAALPGRLTIREAIVDGEAVVLDSEGRPDFSLMQQRMGNTRPSRTLMAQAPVIYYAFDLVYADGWDLRGVSLIDRKRFLKRLLAAGDPIRYSNHVAAEGEELYRLARDRGLEGIIGKHVLSKYCAGRSAGWVKLKTTREIDAVIGGFTAPRGSRAFFGAVLLGVHEKGKLRFIGGAGSGFNQATESAVSAQLRPLVTGKRPFSSTPDTREKATWVEPALVARVKFTEWTRDGRLRAPVFLGLRPDLDPAECRDPREPETAPSPAAPAVAKTRAARAKPAGKPATAAHHATAESAGERCAAQLRASKGATLDLDVEGRVLRLTSLNKVFFPEDGITKRDLLAYYASIADLILPFLRGRPLVLRRMPEGIRGELFYQQETGKTIASWIETVVIESGGRPVRHAVCNNLASLLWLTHLGSIDHNPWSSTVDDLEHPDYVFLDLDPTRDTPFAIAVEVARAVCDVLAAAGLKHYPKTSGATGFHIFVPVEPRYTYHQAATFAEVVSRIAAARVPDRVTFQRVVAKRPPGRILLDYQQLAYGRTLASVYSIRPESQAPVSAPVRPDELESSLSPERFTLRTMPARLKNAGDLWADFWQSRQRIETALERLKTLR